MEEKDDVPPLFLKGFNDGYVMAQYQPDLANKISKATGNSMILDGFKNGVEQYQFDKTQDKLPDWLKTDRIASLDKGNKGEKDKDDKDRE